METVQRSLGIDSGKPAKGIESLRDFDGSDRVIAQVQSVFYSPSPEELDRQMVVIMYKLKAEGCKSRRAVKRYPLKSLTDAEVLERDFAAFGVFGLDADEMDATIRNLLGRSVALSRLPRKGEALDDVVLDMPKWEPNHEARSRFYGFRLSDEFVRTHDKSAMAPRADTTRAEIRKMFGVQKSEIKRYPASSVHRRHR